MANQDTYLAQMAAAFVGMVANAEAKTLISRTAEGATIGFGKAVKQGTADNGVAAATADTDVVRGITAIDQSATLAAGFEVGSSALVLTKGVIWVTAGEAVDAGSPVYMIVGTAQAGNFGDTATNNLAIPNAIFDSSAAAAGDLVKIRLG